jgi:hypothetical protein
MSDITAEFAQDAEVGMEIDDRTKRVIGAAMELYRSLGPGLIINFHAQLLKHGIRRRVLDLEEEIVL